MTKAAFFRFVSFLVLSLSITSCSIPHNELDCVKNPKSIVGKCVSLDSDKVIAASNNSDGIWAFHKDVRDSVNRDLGPLVKEKGNVGAAFDPSFLEKAKSLRSHTKNLARGLNLQNINLDKSGRKTSQPLDVVVLASAKTDTGYPVFKVRVTNKAFAGSEVWVDSSTINRYGFLTSFGH